MDIAIYREGNFLQPNRFEHVLLDLGSKNYKIKPSKIQKLNLLLFLLAMLEIWAKQNGNMMWSFTPLPQTLRRPSGDTWII